MRGLNILIPLDISKHQEATLLNYSMGNGVYHYPFNEQRIGGISI
jgi:hypothetical protein